MALLTRLQVKIKHRPNHSDRPCFLLIDIFKNRTIYKEISKNPLKTYNINPNQVDESVNIEDEDNHL
jgi:hypothetical protein